MNQQPEKALLNLEEFCSYLGIGKTKARELLKNPSSTFTLKIEYSCAAEPRFRCGVSHLSGTS